MRTSPARLASDVNAVMMRPEFDCTQDTMRVELGAVVALRALLPPEACAVTGGVRLCERFRVADDRAVRLRVEACGGVFSPVPSPADVDSVLVLVLLAMTESMADLGAPRKERAVCAA